MQSSQPEKALRCSCAVGRIIDRDDDDDDDDVAGLVRTRTRESARGAPRVSRRNIASPSFSYFYYVWLFFMINQNFVLTLVRRRGELNVDALTTNLLNDPPFSY